MPRKFIPVTSIDLGKIYDYDIILLDLNLPDMSGFDSDRRKMMRLCYDRRLADM
jgi:hypothetical protein